MARVIVALDIGEQAVRMAALQQTGREFSLLELAEEQVLPEDGATGAVTRLMERITVPVDDLVGVFGLEQVSLRSLRLPFSDRKRIDQVLPFELDGVFPFDPEDLVYNYQILQAAKKGEESEILVGATLRERVADRLELYREAGQDPRNLWLDAFALEAASAAGHRAEGGEAAEEPVPTAWLHVDADRSLLLITTPAGFRTARVIRTGRNQLLSRVAAAGTRSAGDLAQVFEAGAMADERAGLLRPLLRDVEQTLRSVEKSAGVRVARLVASGRMAGWPAMAETMGEELHLPVEQNVWDEAAAGTTDGELGDYAPLVGAAVLARRPEGGFDLRCGEFTYTRAIQLVKGKLIFTGALAGVLLLLVVLGNLFMYMSKSAEADRLRSEITQVFQETFPDQPVVDPAQQMRAETRRLQKAMSGSSGASTVDMLKLLSETVGDDTQFEIRELHKDSTGLRIKAETDSYENIESIRQAIAGAPQVQGAKVENSQKRGEVIVFDISIQEKG